MKVMVVEDNEVDMTVITSALEAAGIDFIAVSNSENALDKALEYKPDIAILDIHMPNLSGKEVQRLLSTNPVTSCIKIIFMSATDNVEDVLYGVNVQASAFFRKGVRIGQIISSINAIDSTAKIRTSIDAFASHSKHVSEKYGAVCASH